MFPIILALTFTNCRDAGTPTIFNTDEMEKALISQSLFLVPVYREYTLDSFFARTEKHLSVFVVYDSGDTKKIDLNETKILLEDATLDNDDPYRLTTPGPIDITVRYGSLSAQYTVIVRDETRSNPDQGNTGGDSDPILQSLFLEPVYREYTLRSPFAKTEEYLSVFAVYDSGPPKKIALSETEILLEGVPLGTGIDYPFHTTGKKVITVYYEGLSAQYTIIVRAEPDDGSDPILQSLFLVPVYREYTVESLFAKTEDYLSVFAVYDSGDTEKIDLNETKILLEGVTPVTVAAHYFTTTGEKEIIVRYKNLSAQYTVIVRDPDGTAVSIDIKWN
jgi:hypothetical protein